MVSKLHNYLDNLSNSFCFVGGWKMKGLNYSDNFFPSRRRQALPNLLTLAGVSSPLPPPSSHSRSRARETKALHLGVGVSRGYPAPPSRPRPFPAPVAAAGRGRAACGELLKRGWGKLPQPVAFLRRRWLDHFNKSVFSLSLALPGGTGGGVSPQPPSEKATHTQRASPQLRTARSQRRRSPCPAGPPQPGVGASLPLRLLQGD